MCVKIVTAYASFHHETMMRGLKFRKHPIHSIPGVGEKFHKKSIQSRRRRKQRNVPASSSYPFDDHLRLLFSSVCLHFSFLSVCSVNESSVSCMQMNGRLVMTSLSLDERSAWQRSSSRRHLRSREWSEK